MWNNAGIMLLDKKTVCSGAVNAMLHMQAKMLVSGTCYQDTHMSSRIVCQQAPPEHDGTREITPHAAPYAHTDHNRMKVKHDALCSI